MAAVSRCCNLVIAALYKVDFANTHRYSSPAYTSMSCGWNKSTKTVIKSKKIKTLSLGKSCIQIWVKHQATENAENTQDQLNYKILILEKITKNYDTRMFIKSFVQSFYVKSKCCPL